MNVCPGICAREFPGHVVTTVPQSGWASISNGKLLRLIADSGKFDVFLTMDKNLPQQAKIVKLPFVIVVLRAKSNRLEHVVPFAPLLLRRLGRISNPAALMCCRSRIDDSICAVRRRKQKNLTNGRWRVIKKKHDEHLEPATVAPGAANGAHGGSGLICSTLYQPHRRGWRWGFLLSHPGAGGQH